MLTYDIFFLYTDEIHRCYALQSSSIHHRIDQWEWSRPGGLPPSRITHEPQHDWSLLTMPEPVPYSQSTHILPSPLKVNGNTCYLLRRPITTHLRWSVLILNLEFSQSYLSEDSWSRSLTSSPERLESCCPFTTWLSGFSKDLPTYEANHVTNSKKDGWSFTNSWKTIKHSWQFSKLNTHHCFVDFCHGDSSCIENKDNSDAGNNKINQELWV